MENQRNKQRKIDIIVLVIGGLLPIVLRFLFPDIYHHFDVHTFVEWGKYHDNLSDLYLTECYCNYPYIGMLLSTGILRLFNDSVFAFLSLLSIIDLLNVYLIYRILKSLIVQRAALFAGILGILPAVWVGGGFWGQIDTFGQTLLLGLIWLIIRHKQLNKHHTLIFACYGLFFSVGLLTKQLLLFPLAPIGVYVAFSAFRVTNSVQRGILLLLTSFVAFLLPILLVDASISVPDRFLFSHLERVFFEGSDHMNEISGNGFNVWMFFFEDMGASSEQPFLLLSPKNLGLISFVLLSAWLSYKHLQFHIKKVNRQLILVSLFFFFLLINLGFNLLLTGTHERYLYHFYPFLGIALLYVSRLHLFVVQKIDFVLLLIGGIIYGLFVWGILRQYHHSVYFFQSLIAHRILACFHLILFARLFYQFIQIHKMTLNQPPSND